ncbi:MAG: hypothetical protein R3229_15180 [Alphaproteobacteria bacterium]|nr:hypothetical protein [Alphaproteobacteria bacterium]
MERPLPDPNELWAKFVTAPVGTLSTRELVLESRACSEWIKYLRDRSRKLGNTKTIKAFKALGWVSQVVSLPAIFAEPLTGLLVWTLGATATTGAHLAAKKTRGQLTTVQLLTSLYLTRQRQIVVELGNRAPS